MFGDASAIRWYPSDWFLAGILSVITLTLAVREHAAHADLWIYIALHAGLLALFLMYRAWVRHRLIQSSKWPVAHDFFTLVVLLSLYLTLAKAPFLAFDWRADPVLAQADLWLFMGTDPSLHLQSYVSSTGIEVFSAIYAFFIPYLYFSIFLGLLCRPAAERRGFVNGAAAVYSISYLGYLFAPAMGPVVEYATEFDAALPSGYFYDLVVDSIERGGGPHGAFPSLHVGASLYLCLFDLRFNRLRGLAYLPLVAAIMGATVYLRYHWVVDVIAGCAIAFIGFAVSVRYFQDSRQSASVTMPVTDRAVRLIWCVLIRILWFRRYEVEYKAPFPSVGSVLLVANHRNSLVDAFALIATLRRPVTLTAKETLRHNRLLRLILRLHGVVTFHRRQDDHRGATIAKNSDALQRCVNILSRGGTVCLFPEGVSHSDAEMRKFQGGAARLIAVYREAATKLGLPDLNVVPVGLNYDSKSNIRSNLLIKFGAPMSARSLPGGDGGAEHVTSATRNEITNLLRECVEELTVDFDTKRQAVLLPEVVAIAGYGKGEMRMLGHPPSPLSTEFELLKQFATKKPLPSKISRRIVTFSRKLKAHNATVANVLLPRSRIRATIFVLRETELALIAAPLALIGGLLHAIPVLALWLITWRLSEDEDHWASNFLGPAFVALPIWYAVTCVLVGLFAGGLAAALFVPVTLLAGYVAIQYLDRISEAFDRARIYLTFWFKPKLRRELVDELLGLRAALSEFLPPKTMEPRSTVYNHP